MNLFCFIYVLSPAYIYPNLHVLEPQVLIEVIFVCPSMLGSIPNISVNIKCVFTYVSPYPKLFFSAQPPILRSY